MPVVDGKEYPYTKAGIKAAEKAKKKKGKKGGDCLLIALSTEGEKMKGKKRG